MGVNIWLGIFALVAVSGLVLQGMIGNRLKKALESESGEEWKPNSSIQIFLTGWRRASDLGITWLMTLWTMNIFTLLVMLLGFCLTSLLFEGA